MDLNLSPSFVQRDLLDKMDGKKKVVFFTILRSHFQFKKQILFNISKSVRISHSWLTSDILPDILYHDNLLFRHWMLTTIGQIRPWPRHDLWFSPEYLLECFPSVERNLREHIFAICIKCYM